MKYKIAGLAVALMLVSAALAATAFTSGSVTRSSSVDVVSDDQALIGLSDGNSGDLVWINSSGALQIDFGKASGSSGVNTEAHFELGDPNDASNVSAFNVTNQAGETLDLTVEYTGAGTGDADPNIQFKIYDSSGVHQDTVTEGNTSTTLSSVASGTTYHVVIVVDTHGVTNTTDLSGTLKVSA